jgi:hypothetical protein
MVYPRPPPRVRDQEQRLIYDLSLQGLLRGSSLKSQRLLCDCSLKSLRLLRDLSLQGFLHDRSPKGWSATALKSPRASSRPPSQELKDCFVTTISMAKIVLQSFPLRIASQPLSQGLKIASQSLSSRVASQQLSQGSKIASQQLSQGPKIPSRCNLSLHGLFRNNYLKGPRLLRDLSLMGCFATTISGVKDCFAISLFWVASQPLPQGSKIALRSLPL